MWVPFGLVRRERQLTSDEQLPMTALPTQPWDACVCFVQHVLPLHALRHHFLQQPPPCCHLSAAGWGFAVLARRLGRA